DYYCCSYRSGITWVF
nr:immunoglobulin light chain junction region [Macaca mulatta]MOX70624.1 immunoglobulin light chain junction region [Macaca mulatta]MOX70977.1 immunoglobulin light chain junction region [Macaca mulatta]MOX71043.1 immunoglobulin light chain junction region [Macaca mulatta]MOX71328.1 immunoglobulin light chain junction region [Macaca mulatta]